MPDNILKAIITADNSGLNKAVNSSASDLDKLGKSFEELRKRGLAGIGNLQRQVASFGGGVKSFSNVAVSSLKNIAPAANQASRALSTIPNASNQATLSMINLGRVVQDAPYGFIGIANNLNPLIESFQRTSKAAGGFTGGLKALGSSLLGAGGIGLAVSVISTGLILFGDRLFGASKQANALDESIKKLSESVSDDITKLTTIVGVIKNVNTSNVDREKALKAINQEYEPYIKNLGIEQVTLGNINTAYEKIIDNLLRQAVVKGLQEQISKAVEETAAQVLKLEIAQEQQRIASERAAKQLSAEEIQARNLANAEKLRTGVVRDGTLAQIQADAALKADIATNFTYEARLKAIKKQLQEQIQPLLNVTDKFADLGITLNDAGKKGDKSMDNLISKAKELADFLNKTTIREFKFEVSPLETKEQTAAKAKRFIDDALGFIEGTGNAIELRQVFNIKPEISGEFQKSVSDAVLDKLGLIRLPDGSVTIDLNKPKIETRKTLESIGQGKITGDLQKKLQDVANGKPISILFPVEIQLAIAEQDKLVKQFQSFVQGVQNTIQQVAADAAAQFGEALGTAFAGGDLKNVFNGFVNIIASGLQSIGKQFIVIGGVAKAAKLALEKVFTNPALAVAAGIALVAAGAALRQSVNKGIQGREFGGPVVAGQPYIVGERRPELFIPNTGGRIVPNLNALTGGRGPNGGGMHVEVSGAFELRGNNLVASIARTNRYQGINT